jgi:hypothetical protein
MLTDAEMELPTVAVESRKRDSAFDLDAAISCEVSASTHQSRNHRKKSIQNLLSCIPRGDGLTWLPNRK